MKIKSRQCFVYELTPEMCDILALTFVDLFMRNEFWKHAKVPPHTWINLWLSYIDLASCKYYCRVSRINVGIFYLHYSRIYSCKHKQTYNQLKS